MVHIFSDILVDDCSLQRYNVACVHETFERAFDILLLSTRYDDMQAPQLPTSNCFDHGHEIFSVGGLIECIEDDICRWKFLGRLPQDIQKSFHGRLPLPIVGGMIERVQLWGYPDALLR